jgi:superfamily II helicase
MTQELIDLRNSILEGRYADALEIVDELEGMSKQAILRNIQAFLRILLIHLIKNQIEQRLTNSWAASIHNSLVEIKKINLKENKKSYYINQDEWGSWLEDEIELAVADASVEVLNGNLRRSQLSQMLNKSQLVLTATELLTKTYNYSIRELPDIIDDYLAQLPGGEEWINR